MCHNRYIEYPLMYIGYECYIEYSLMYIGYECDIIRTLNIINIHLCIS